MPRKIGESQPRKCNLNMRTTEEMRSRLEEACASSGRALAHEVEYRLERSFDREDIKAEIKAAFRELAQGRSDPLGFGVDIFAIH